MRKKNKQGNLPILGFPQPFQPTYRFEHRRHSRHADIHPSTSMWPEAVVDVGLQGAVEPDFQGIGERGRVSTSEDEIYEDLLVRGLY